MHRTSLVCFAYLVSIVSAAPAACSSPFSSCFDTRCCSNYGFACFKRAGKQYAMCKRKGTACGTSDPDWECPGDPAVLEAAQDIFACQPNYKGCFESACCTSPGFGCYKRPGVQYAQCRPIDPTRTCTSTDEWECPGTWTPPTPERLGLKCAKPFGNCLASKCCAGAAFSCYQKNPHYAQCLKEAPPGGTLIEVAHPKVSRGAPMSAIPSSEAGGGVSLTIVIFALALICGAGVSGYIFRDRIDEKLASFMSNGGMTRVRVSPEAKSASQKKASGLDDKLVKKEKKKADKAAKKSKGKAPETVGGTSELMAVTHLVDCADEDEDGGGDEKDAVPPAAKSVEAEI